MSIQRMTEHVALLPRVQVTLSNGMCVTAYPHLFSYVVDDPEGKDLTCIKGGNTKHSCELCWVDHNNLANMGVAFAERTIERQRIICEAICEATTAAEKAEISMEHSTHPVPSCLWGWRFGDMAGPTNMMLCVGYDSLHNDDLGVWCYIVKHVGSYLNTKLGKVAANKVRMPVSVLHARRHPRTSPLGWL